MSARKREGDGRPPWACGASSHAYYRPDKVRRPRTALKIEPLRKNSGWCDDAKDRNYNRKVTLPYPASAEPLWRDDHLYDVVVVLDYNLMPRVRGHGSAISFMSPARASPRPRDASRLSGSISSGCWRP